MPAPLPGEGAGEVVEGRNEGAELGTSTTRGEIFGEIGEEEEMEVTL